MSLKTISATSCGIIYNGIDYKFIGLTSVNLNDPRITSLTRGADAKDRRGIPWDAGTADPIVITTIIKMQSDIFKQLNVAQKNKERIDFYYISDVDGSRTSLQDGLIQAPIRQLTIDESADSLSYTIMVAGYELVET